MKIYATLISSLLFLFFIEQSYGQNISASFSSVQQVKGKYFPNDFILFSEDSIVLLKVKNQHMTNFNSFRNNSKKISAEFLSSLNKIREDKLELINNSFFHAIYPSINKGNHLLFSHSYDKEKKEWEILGSKILIDENEIHYKETQSLLSIKGTLNEEINNLRTMSVEKANNEENYILFLPDERDKKGPTNWSFCAIDQDLNIINKNIIYIDKGKNDILQKINISDDGSIIGVVSNKYSTKSNRNNDKKILVLNKNGTYNYLDISKYVKGHINGDEIETYDDRIIYSCVTSTNRGQLANKLIRLEINLSNLSQVHKSEILLNIKNNSKIDKYFSNTIYLESYLTDDHSNTVFVIKSRNSWNGYNGVIVVNYNSKSHNTLWMKNLPINENRFYSENEINFSFLIDSDDKFKNLYFIYDKRSDQKDLDTFDVVKISMLNGEIENIPIKVPNRFKRYKTTFSSFKILNEKIVHYSLWEKKNIPERYSICKIVINKSH